MKEQLVTFEVAKLAKEKGYKVKYESGQFFFLADKDENYLKDKPHRTPFEHYAYILSSTQSLLQKWLRDEHDIQVYSYSHTVRGGDKGKKFGDYIYVVNPLYGDTVLMGDSREGKYQSYEESLEKGIYQALKLIKI